MQRSYAALFASLWILAAISGCAGRNEQNGSTAARAAVSQADNERECVQWAAATLSQRPDVQIPPSGCDCDSVRAAQPFQISGLTPNTSVDPVVTLSRGSVEVICRNDSPNLWLLPREFHGSCGGCAVVRRK
ncbi:MAG TPA: hypothetical protein VMT58_02850 [Candidatus Binataceae bacterium]|nr:hypothetical protein [Candidatus Binataceae bacterium]